ncbi:Zn-dependent hydrolase [Acuticoccus kandeliae]|uniref:Zn-dependent hydrolase n=1 Tax=Acuticoccus kandeliae TaxID=2073160 RepID=UPI000D3E7C9E|nr:Zn-dependent hydrolase [Acuticoccus kandeliae]
MPTPELAVDGDRLAALLAGINRHGANPSAGGFDRLAFSPADMAARRWFAEEMARDGLAVRSDAVGNVFGRFGPADGPTVMIGSHLDTVARGGAFDGALGCAVALECVRALKDAGLGPRLPIEVVATADEEGRFGGMLGSQAIAGAATEDWVAGAADADGVRLVDAMREAGLDPDGVAGAAREKGSIRAFLELHIEQGPVLEAEGVPVGVADSVSGVCVLQVELAGRANHSGTTPMAMRSDAFVGLSEVGTAMPDIAARHGTDEARITIGHVEIAPNAPHTIPGRAVFTIVIRDVTIEAMLALRAAVGAAIAQAAARHGLEHTVEALSWLNPVRLDTDLHAHLLALAASLGIRARSMPSGAGHDAQTMAAIAPTALIFVPSVGGVSHAPEEFTAWADILPGANLALRALAEISGAI